MRNPAYDGPMGIFTDYDASCNHMFLRRSGVCTLCGFVSVEFAKPQNVSREWANLFLELGWKVAVYLWDEGRLFSEDAPLHLGWNRQREPHCVAQGE